ncbi:hypothetical protein P3W45_000399 [Vairimorpha bombi]|jgi:DNA polymerase alpha subunit B
MEDDFLSILKAKKKLNIQYPSYKEITYFYLKKSDRYNYIKERISRNKLHFEELTNGFDIKPVNYQSKKSFFTYGTIIITQDKEIFLYNNTDSSNDTLIKLNLDYWQRFSLFNSQLVLIRGKNVGNNELVVEGINCMPVLDVNKSESSNDYKIMAINQLKDVEIKADLVIFIGCVNIKEMKKLVENNESTVFIHVPTLDQLDNINVYPQPPSKYRINNLKTLPNPCSFFIDDRMFIVNTLPILDELMSQEVFRNENVPKDDLCGDILFEKDLINRLCYHLIFQKSYLPMVSKKYNVQYNIEALDIDITPDFYIIRSEKFGYFCREIGPTKIINIGTLYNFLINIQGDNIQMNILE